MFNKILQSIKDLLFPVFCVKCGLEGDWLCEKCFLKVQLKPVLRCPACRKKNDGSLCLGCQGFFSLDGVCAVFEYKEDEPLGQLVRDFKYHYARDIIFVWKKIFEQFFDSDCPDFLNGENQWTVVSVPLYPRRERERGYNQAALLAQIICQKINSLKPEKVLVMNNILKRVRPTSQQAKLTKEERVKNVENAFVVISENIPKNVILVDDVFTSGVTLFECARLLKQSGVKRVWAITLSRSLFD